jgi:NAD(P) transhydrogenase subunit alpha
MRIGIPRERRPNEARVAVSPDTVKKLVALGPRS